MDAFGCMVQGSFLTYMYSVSRHSRRSSSSRNRTGKPYAAHLARLGYLLIYFPTQVQLTLTKIIKIVATRWRILRLKCTKFDFGWGSAPYPAGGAYNAPPDPLAGFGGPTIKEREREGRGRRGGEGKGGEGRGGERKGHEPPTIWRKFTPMCYSASGYWISSKSEHPLRKYDVISISQHGGRDR